MMMYLHVCMLLLAGRTQSQLSLATSAPVLSANASHYIPQPSLDADNDDDDDNDGDAGDRGSSRYRWRRRQDSMLYIILGIVVGAILVGVLVALFVCARQQHRRRLLLGNESLAVLL